MEKLQSGDVQLTIAQQQGMETSELAVRSIANKPTNQEIAVAGRRLRFLVIGDRKMDAERPSEPICGASKPALH